MLDEASEDARLWGIDLPEGWADRTGFEGIWKVNEDAYHAFLHVSGQWRTAARGMGGIHWIGLDYASVRAGLDFAGVQLTPETWTDLRLIEAGAVEEMNRER